MKLADAFLLGFKAVRNAVRPKLPLTVSEWADAHRKLSEEGSAERGDWHTSRTPFLREIMDCLSEDSPVREVYFMKSSQVGGTEVGVNWIGYIMHHAKGPCAVVMPTDKSLKDWFSQKFDPMAEHTAVVRDVMAARSNRAGDNSADRKRFTGGILYAKTAGSTADLKATSLRYALADELDEWAWATTQGDPLGMLIVRLTTFYDRKLFAPSSPTLKDASRIEEKFEEGDQRRYMMACPHCGERQHLKWANLQWNKVGRRIDAAWYACEHCGGHIEEHHKPAMLAGGVWQAFNPGAPHRSYHINALYSPIGLGLSWVELAAEWLAAQGDPAKLMRFVNTRLGETWADRSHDLKPNVLMARAEPYDLRTIPLGCLVLTAGVDTQDDRLEIHIVGWGADGKCWIIDYHVLYGNPAGEEIWLKLADYLNSAVFTNAFGKTLRIEATAVDTGGHHTHMVYGFVRANLVRRPLATKGASTPGRAVLGKPSQQDVNWRGQTIKRGVALYMIGTDTGKALLYGRLNDDSDKAPEERRIRFSHQLEVNYYEGLTAETYNPRKNRWELKKGRRNEVLDTWVLALAASHHPELYLHKWKKSDWQRRAAMLEPEAVSQVEPAVEIQNPAVTEVRKVNAKKVKPPRRGGFVGSWS